MKLSIITINLNNVSGLQKTIESVICQTFRDFEYIVIDGAGTDGSVEVIEQYAEKINYWISEPDTGIYNAMNKGILKATGTYCLFLNSGDTLYSETVLENVFTENYSEDIITGDMLRIYSDKTVLDKGQACIRSSEGQKLTLFDLFFGFMNHQATFIKKELFSRFGLYDENYKIVSDWLFFLNVIGLHGVQVKYINTIISCFDMTGVSNTNMELSRNERQIAIQSIFHQAVIDDYKYFEKVNTEYKILKSKYDYLFQYRITYFIAKFVNKLIRLFHPPKNNKI